MARPSPRTQGCAEYDENGKCIKPFQKFGTQQLEFVAPVVYGTPYQGVVQKEVGQTFKGFTTSGYTGTKTTVFSERFQAGITGAVPVELHEEAVRRQKEKLEEMGIPTWEFPDLTTLFPPASPNGNGKKEECHLDDNKPFCAITQAIGGEVCECPDWFTGKVTDPTAGGRGCECEACKNGTGQCDASAPECDAWDLGCIAGTHVTDVITNPVGSWWDKYGNYVYLILGVIGLGVLLWLLRPLFGIAKNITD